MIAVALHDLVQVGRQLWLARCVCVGCSANVPNSSAHIRVQVGLEMYARHSPLYGDGKAVTRIYSRLTGWWRPLWSCLSSHQVIAIPIISINVSRALFIVYLFTIGVKMEWFFLNKFIWVLYYNPNLPCLMLCPETVCNLAHWRWMWLSSHCLCLNCAKHPNRSSQGLENECEHLESGWGEGCHSISVFCTFRCYKWQIATKG